MGSCQPLPLEAIRTDGGTQPRAEIDHDLVLEYAGALEGGAAFPPVVVYYDGSDRWLADGFHRHAAHRLAGRKTIDAEVQSGTKRDAILFSFGANDAHGKRRSNDDKRRAVEGMLSDPEWARWADREIARQCRVSHTYVAKLRAASGNDASERLVTRAGATFTMNVSSIGVRARVSESEFAQLLAAAPPFPCAPGVVGVAEGWAVTCRESDEHAGFYHLEIINFAANDYVQTKRPVRANAIRAMLVLEGIPVDELCWSEVDRGSLPFCTEAA